jgi:exonuclease SbcC
MCYGEDVSPLDFHAIHVACISGKNGHGKSALIDAMTWALWGQARARSGDDLVKTGRAEMAVEFDFEVAGRLYRVLRKHARPAKRARSGRTILELQMASGDGAFQTITGNNIAQTQLKIKDILHVDYETFINSALLLQGHADEFTRQTPVKRKEVLASILGLAYYDELEDRARERVRQLDAEKSQLEAAVSAESGELEQKPVFETAMVEAQAERSRLEVLVREQEERLGELRQQRDALESKKQQLERLNGDIARRQGDLERWGEQAAQHRRRIGEYQGLRDQREAIEAGYLEFTGVRQSVGELERRLRAVVGLNERKHRLEMTVIQAQQALNQEHVLVQSRIQELESAAQKIESLGAELREARAELDGLARAESALEEKRGACQELRAGQHYLETAISQLEREKGEIEEKVKLLLTGDDTRCPLCETELGTEHIHIIEGKYQKERRERDSSRLANQDELARKRKELELLEAEIARTEVALKEDRAKAQNRAGVLREQLRVAEEAAGALAGEREKLAEIEGRLARKEFAAGEQRMLAELEGELAGTGYDTEQHDRERQRLEALEKHDTEKRGLDEADRLFGQEEEALARAERARSELAAALEADTRNREELAGEITLLPRVGDDLDRVEIQYRALAGEQRQIQERVGELRAGLERCAELEKRLAETGKKLAGVAQAVGIYRELALAFGKRGVQALLIEVALPEIEAEANRLLSRMTDGRMNVKIETQRETKTGDLAETLDIKISDELGTRNYEMFSGGEAFRINFALRIALSRLLARRAGAPLPTLIIDEGFGTQDSDGIEKLKEAINSIQDDFQKILVITHIDELRDVFPARIDVIKTEQGSNIQLN